MSRPPLAVAVVWHMHQPWYHDDAAGTFVLPWVRRRGTKDYLHMLQLLERHPEMRVTMNMVPSLLTQLEMYAAGEPADAERDLCLRSAADLTAAEREFLVAGARREDYGRRVSLLAPYLQLLDRLPDRDASRASLDDMRDLQVWTLLLAFDPDQIRADAELLSLVTRGGDFTELDKQRVDSRQLALLRTVIPAYRDAVASGRVEAMTSPYHHPILPLLIDATSARVASPDIELPERPMRDEEAAREQVRRGRAEFARITGSDAVGMWPPECAVSPAAAALLRACGARYAVSDEGVLARTLRVDDVRAGGELYRAHADAGGLTMVFRDAQLSNLVGFTYQSMPAATAAADLVHRLSQIAAAPGPDDAPRLVTIALDGENFKDFYEENATPFLDAFYAELVASPLLQTTHIGAFLDAHPHTELPLPQLWTGSWIDADLRTWIGEPAHNRAWTLLASARDALLGAGGPTVHPRAHGELLIAEGSDWYWWFGTHHDSGSDAAWDALFRTHLRNAYSLAGLVPPTELDRPVVDSRALSGDCAPLRAIDPQADGPTEWQSAGTAEVGAALGSMRPPASSVSRILYGAGGGRLHLRFDGGAPRFDRAIIDAGAAGRLVVDRPVRNLAVALPGAAVDFSVVLEESARGAERVPASGALHVAAPAAGSPRPVRVLIVAAECAPLAVAGQLAEMVATTAADAARLGHDVVVVVPRHRGAALGDAPGVRLARLDCTGAGARVSARLLQGALPHTRIPALSVDAPAYFDREALYGAADDGERYFVFCALVAELLRATAFAPDIVHGFEWQTAALLAGLATATDAPATILSAGEGSPGYRVDAASLGAIGVTGAPPSGDVDLLEMGLGAATLVERTPRTGSLGDLYRSALDRARSVP